MTKTFYLYDLENQPLKKIINPVSEDVHHVIFFTDNTKGLPASVVQTIHNTPSSFLLIRVEGKTKDNMDFHIAATLGELVRSDPSSSLIIVSGDKGYDSVIAYYKNKGIDVSRISQNQFCSPSPNNHQSLTNQTQPSAKKIKKNRKSPTLKIPHQDPLINNPPIPLDPKVRQILTLGKMITPHISKIPVHQFPCSIEGLANHIQGGKLKHLDRDRIITFIGLLIAMSILVFNGKRFAINAESPQYEPFNQFLKTASPPKVISCCLNHQFPRIA